MFRGQKRAKPPKRLLITTLWGALIAQWSFLGTKSRRMKWAAFPFIQALSCKLLVIYTNAFSFINFCLLTKWNVSQFNTNSFSKFLHKIVIKCLAKHQSVLPNSKFSQHWNWKSFWVVSRDKRFEPAKQKQFVWVLFHVALPLPKTAY